MRDPFPQRTSKMSKRELCDWLLLLSCPYPNLDLLRLFGTSGRHCVIPALWWNHQIVLVVNADVCSLNVVQSRPSSPATCFAEVRGFTIVWYIVEYSRRSVDTSKTHMASNDPSRRGTLSLNISRYHMNLD